MNRTMLITVAAFFAIAIVGAVWWWRSNPSLTFDPDDTVQVELGRTVYGANCARCHGAKLEGEANWQQRKVSGRLPAPPHDGSGHTWHHADAQLFGIVKNGITAYAPPGYESDMPAFGATLTDADIAAVLAYIKSSWPPDIREKQKQISRAQP